MYSTYHIPPRRTCGIPTPSGCSAFPARELVPSTPAPARPGTPPSWDIRGRIWRIGPSRWPGWWSPQAPATKAWYRSASATACSPGPWDCITGWSGSAPPSFPPRRATPKAAQIHAGFRHRYHRRHPVLLSVSGRIGEETGGGVPARTISAQTGAAGQRGLHPEMRDQIEQSWGGGFFATDNYGMSELNGPGMSGECRSAAACTSTKIISSARSSTPKPAKSFLPGKPGSWWSPT